MSYSIRYGQDTKQEARMKKQSMKKWIGIVCVVAAMTAGILMPQIRELAHKLLFPWLNEATAAAFGVMVQKIGEGNAGPAAFLDFCREVIGNALVPV